jgi:hypothetical protein
MLAVLSPNAPAIAGPEQNPRRTNRQQWLRRSIARDERPESAHSARSDRFSDRSRSSGELLRPRHLRTTASGQHEVLKRSHSSSALPRSMTPSTCAVKTPAPRAPARPLASADHRGTMRTAPSDAASDRRPSPLGVRGRDCAARTRNRQPSQYPSRLGQGKYCANIGGGGFSC